MNPSVKLLDQFGEPMASLNGGGAGFGGQMLDYTPALQSADAAILPGLDLGNARSDDLRRNNGIASGGVQLHIDNIVGHSYRLSYKPRNKRLGADSKDLADFRKDAESLWMEEAEDPIGCWLDAERKRTFTMMIREGIGTHTTLGEIMASAGWDTSPGRPCRTNIKLVSPKRVSNPNNAMDTSRLRGGIEFNHSGASLAFNVRSQDHGAIFGNGYGYKWDRIDRETKHGRPKFIHIFEPTEDGQSRGTNQFLSVMEQLHMLPKLQHTKLQEAIINAMYAAVIETELGSDAAFEVIGSEGGTDNIQKYMALMAQYHKGANIKMNGAKIPHLVPGENLKLLTSGNADNGFVNLEESILRWTARGLNVPYESLAQNYSKTSYSSARASMLEGWRYFMGRRKIIASSFASQIFSLWLEEKIQRGNLVIPRSAKYGFYEAKSAWCNAEWIGSGRLAIDGLKEVKESVLRIESGLSTYEKEAALMGEDYQELFEQQIYEMAERKKGGLPQASWVLANQFAPDEMPEQTPAAMSDR